MRKVKVASRTLAGGLALLAVLFQLACQNQPAAPTGVPAVAAPTKAPAPATSGNQAAPATGAAPAAPTTAVPTAPAQTLKIGIPTAFTSPMAANLKVNYNSYMTAVEDINAKGGLVVAGKTYRIEVVTAEDKGTAEGGREACDNLLLAEKVKIIIGVGTAAAQAGCQPGAEQAMALLVGQGYSAAMFGAKHPTTFLVGPPMALVRYGGINRWLAKTYPAAKGVVFIASDDASGKAETESFEATAKESGLNILGEELYPAGLKDFASLVTRVLAKKPDVVELSAVAAATPAGFLSIAKSLAEQGYKGLFVGAAATPSIVQAGPTAGGFVYPYLLDEESPLIPAQAKDVAMRIKQKYGADGFNIQSATFAYNAVSVTAQAMQKAGTVDDAQKIAEVMRSNQWDTLYGKIGFGGVKTTGIASVLELPLFLGKVEGGKAVNFDMQPGTLP